MESKHFSYICTPQREAQVAKLVDALCSGRSVRKDVLVRIQREAQVAKLVDALCSGRSVRKDVLVRIQSWAPEKSLNES